MIEQTAYKSGAVVIRIVNWSKYQFCGQRERKEPKERENKQQGLVVYSSSNPYQSTPKVGLSNSEQQGNNKIIEQQGETGTAGASMPESCQAPAVPYWIAEERERKPEPLSGPMAELKAKIEKEWAERGYKPKGANE